MHCNACVHKLSARLESARGYENAVRRALDAREDQTTLEAAVRMRRVATAKDGAQ